MKILIRLVILVMLISVTIMTFVGCPSIDPPSVEEIENILRENYDDFTIINNFLVDSDYRDIRIYSANGMMKVNSDEIPIDNAEVNAAIKRLSSNSVVKYIDKSGHTIHYQLWTRFRDVGCGLAFSSAEGFAPTIQYLTELVPLSYDGWYYYVDDYNEWRIQQESEG